MHHARVAALAILTVVAGCGGSSSKPAPAPPAAPAVAADCADYEHQVDLCRPGCDTCAGEAPGNSCNVCAEGCATQIWCQQCGTTEGCP